MRFLLVLVVWSSVARADALDAKAIEKKLAACASEDARATLGAIEKAETIGKRPASRIVQVIGKKARGYVVWDSDDMCTVVPVIGKPAAFVKGNFGNGATVAYALAGRHCDPTCVMVVSLKSADDKLLDVLPLNDGCSIKVSMAKRSVFAGRDSIELGCWGAAGADPHRGDTLLDAGTGALSVLLDVNAGVAWYQLDKGQSKSGGPACQARPPGGMRIQPGSVDATQMAEPAQAEAAKLEYHSGGCEATVATQRYVVAGNKLVKKGAPKLSIAKNLCTCKK